VDQQNSVPIAQKILNDILGNPGKDQEANLPVPVPNSKKRYTIDISTIENDVELLQIVKKKRLELIEEELQDITMRIQQNEMKFNDLEKEYDKLFVWKEQLQERMEKMSENL